MAQWAFKPFVFCSWGERSSKLDVITSELSLVVSTGHLSAAQNHQFGMMQHDQKWAEIQRRKKERLGYVKGAVCGNLHIFCLYYL